ncbi:MAG: hypothetical protein U1C51_04020, partial [Candidatus Izemoplasmatales bacterium]|nr:hypothetical protein [Candidatus Izemoplasmatales bacterium]
MRKEKELQEKLEFYNMKLIGYKGVSYDRIGSSGSRSSGDSELLYWLEKIDKIKDMIEKNELIIKKYEYFKIRLKKNLSILLETIVGGQKIRKNEY